MYVKLAEDCYIKKTNGIMERMLKKYPIK